ncbi:uncharacterized protein FOMMEDRAFT_156547 [Fomitiporia mediterranea MF3/22]|uniref:uncharacterized protein n=1 Tax=Fomitiporia mediterranea (strain MF3/22) TaxID=694068 RepID=UPI00044083F3|nr:uncharacterized protein FOMMEDRAFT_156547 [Fomitiporia mediterranea MF3/22]EJD03173.1 hypothetical protein FOMMEDRAFT_156547 [Fomitiporia mediterranea MF3/22]
MAGSTLVGLFFAILIIGGHIGIPLILLTISLCKKLQRHPLLLGFLTSWVLYTTSFCLLLYTGHQYDDEKPLALCITQLSMVYGSAISTPLSGLALISNVCTITSLRDFEGGTYTEVRFGLGLVKSGEVIVSQQTILRKSWMKGMNLAKSFQLLIIPYAAFVLVAVFFAIEVSQEQSSIDRSQNSLYCARSNEQGVPYISTIIILACVVFEILIIWKLVKLRRKFEVSKDKLKADMSVRLFIRTGIFTIYGGLSLLAAVQFWFESRSNFMFAHIIQASMPFAAFLIFGTQKDLLTAWGILPLALCNRLLGLGKKSPPPRLDEDEFPQAPRNSQDIRKPSPVVMKESQKPLVLPDDNQGPDEVVLLSRVPRFPAIDPSTLVVWVHDLVCIRSALLFKYIEVGFSTS